MGKMVPVRISLVISSAFARSHAILLVGAAFSTGVGQGFAIGVEIKCVSEYWCGCVGVWAGKTPSCGKSSVQLSTALPFISRAFRRYADRLGWYGFRR